MPLTILRKKGATLDGSHPTLLTGYGGYGISQHAALRATLNRVWLDQGGVFAEANLRGGGEFGEAWHEAGKLTNKQNVFDDFYACAQALVDDGLHAARAARHRGRLERRPAHGRRAHAAPRARSARSSRSSASTTCSASSSSPNGAFNVTEFGTVKDEAQFRRSSRTRRYHHVDDGDAVPGGPVPDGRQRSARRPVPLAQDDRAPAGATASGLPVLLRTSADTGHGIGTPLDERVEQSADVYAFLAEQLGIAVP